jgi:hypothetical protein
MLQFNYGSFVYATAIYYGLLYIYLLLDKYFGMEDVPLLLDANRYIGRYLHIDLCYSVLPALVKMCR